MMVDAELDETSKTEESIRRQNIDILLDAVESTAKAEADKGSGCWKVDSGSAIRRQNIEMLLDAAASTKHIDESFFRLSEESGNEFDTPVDRVANVVVEKIVTYDFPKEGYDICKSSFDSDAVIPVERTCDAPAAKNRQPCRGRSKRRGGGGGAPAKRLKLNKMVGNVSSEERLSEASADQSCRMVVPVDPLSCQTTDNIGDCSDVDDDDGGVGDDASTLLEVEVPGPFRSVGTKESAHSEEAVGFVLSNNLMKKFKCCPTCGQQVALNITTLTFRCSRMLPTPSADGRKRRCQWHQSARPGTWFENAHMSLQGVLHITFLWLVMRRPRQDFVMEELQCSSRTVVDWASYCREVCIYWAQSGSENIGGEGRTVEVFEPKIVNRKRKGTQIMDGKWVFGGFEPESGKFFIASVSERSRESLLAVIKKWVRPDTVVMSDCWRSLKCLGNTDFRRQAAKHCYTFVDFVNGEQADCVKHVWREVKCSIPRSGPCDSHLLGYLGEFLFKRKFTNSEARTVHFFEVVAKLYPGN